MYSDEFTCKADSRSLLLMLASMPVTTLSPYVKSQVPVRFKLATKKQHTIENIQKRTWYRYIPVGRFPLYDNFASAPGRIGEGCVVVTGQVFGDQSCVVRVDLFQSGALYSHQREVLRIAGL